ncbi:MAG: DUF262 domain-containing protein, partial [Candidatus Pacearchaeota archaeon]|nr:DUF262 domain-containing protein [Candidatus Pacearchaeota archaeon]
MRELIFNIADVFNDRTAEGCLTQYEATHYHIPAYQRGYKWGVGPGQAVTVLLNDLWSAFRSNESEYYLQYITVKRQKTERGDSWLEVIDGQQRLTTLSILISVLHALTIDEHHPIPNIAKDKLDYAVRGPFFSEHIYDYQSLNLMLDASWGDFIELDRDRFDRQDIFYIHAAAQEIHQFFVAKQDQIFDFYQYLCRKIKLIINSVERHIQSETVFRNLNSNKVPLTQTELAKGLLLTKAGRERVMNAENHFREVLEVRIALGKEWESIQKWARQPEICSFFFEGKSDGMSDLLALTAQRHDKAQYAKFRREQKGEFLFDYLSQTKNIDEVFKLLIYTQQRLNGWFQNNELYHLIGFCRFCYGSKNNNPNFLLDCLEKTTYSELKAFLNIQKNSLIFGRNETVIHELSYEEDKSRLHAILLALSIFPD